MQAAKLKLQRFLQDAGLCSVAAASSIANFYDKAITYDYVKSVIKTDDSGMYTPDIAIMLNRLGFKSVRVVTANIDQVDFKWQNLSKNKMLQEIKKAARYHPDESSKEVAKSYAKFLSDKKNNNELIIDTHFGDHIREQLDQKKPILASFNWNLFFKYPKWNDYGAPDPIRGESEEHEVVIYGYDDSGVMILDSHHELYKGKLKKYANGRYKMDWETLMTVMGLGDLILPDNYSA